MRIDYLFDHRDLIPSVAGWIYDEWGHIVPEDSAEECARRLARQIRRTQIPTSFVALCGDTPVGTASLVGQDLETRPDLSPWMAAVYVAREHRRRGIGGALVARVVREAAALGIATLYLYTFDKEQFYTRLGWSLLERTEYHCDAITIMKRNIAGEPTC